MLICSCLVRYDRDGGSSIKLVIVGHVILIRVSDRIGKYLRGTVLRTASDVVLLLLGLAPMGTEYQLECLDI